MVSLTLATSLAALVPADPDGAMSARRSITLDADSWPEAVTEIRLRFGRLATHVFDAAGGLRPGLIAAVNAEVCPQSGDHPRIKHGDEVFLFAQIAGG
jgi:molybdopterin converting factor small subunit